jgi:hypothetical protein
LARSLCDLHLVGEGQVVRNDVVCIGAIEDARDQESVAKIFNNRLNPARACDSH